MKSLFNPADNQEILDRINRLTPAARPLWGKMTVAQMVTHSQAPLRVAMGELKLKRGLIGLLFGKMAKKKLMREGSFEKNMATHPVFVVKNEPEFEMEKQKLTEMVKQFAERGESVLSKDPHPFFGPMSVKDWDVLQWKHLDHHLRQFGV